MKHTKKTGFWFSCNNFGNFVYYKDTRIITKEEYTKGITNLNEVKDDL